MLGEPDLDLTRLTADAASGGQVEVHGTGRTTSRSVRNHAPRFERRTPASAQKFVEWVLARTRCSRPHPMVAKISLRAPSKERSALAQAPHSANARFLALPAHSFSRRQLRVDLTHWARPWAMTAVCAKRPTRAAFQDLEDGGSGPVVPGCHAGCYCPPTKRSVAGKKFE
jgi:hypothetical protein